MAQLVEEPQQSLFDFESGNSTLYTPTYSLAPSQNEITLDGGHGHLSSSGGLTWTYQTKHMTIDLGRRLWQTSSPTYGLNDKIEGSIKLSGHPAHIEHISVTLEGNLITSVLGNGGAIGSTTLFMAHTVSVPLVHHPGQGDEYSFIVPIPSEVTVQGIKQLAPPSFYRVHVGMTGEIAYSLRISMTAQANRGPFKRESDETKIIPILYFPKTRPMDPPLASIPKPPSDYLQSASPNVHLSEHVDTFPLTPQWSSSHAKRTSLGLERFKKSVFFSLPAPQSFASGERIPFFISLVFSDSPVQAAMYAKNIRVSLMRQLTVRPVAVKTSLDKLIQKARSQSPRSWASSSHEDEEDSPSSGRSSPSLPSSDVYGPPATRRWKVTTGHLETLSEYSEGVYLLRGWISAGELGRGCSWQLGHLAQLQYFLEIEITSPELMEEHLPAFRLTKEVEIMTDGWETMNRELRSTGGIPTPALGLARCLQGKEIRY